MGLMCLHVSGHKGSPQQTMEKLGSLNIMFYVIDSNNFGI